MKFIISGDSPALRILVIIISYCFTPTIIILPVLASGIRMPEPHDQPILSATESSLKKKEISF